MPNGLISFTDPRTGRRVLLPELDPDRLSVYEYARLEALARRWCRPATRRAALAELDSIRSTDPAATIYGFSWLLATWALMREARTGVPAQQLICGLDGDEARRYEAGQRAHELWDWLNHTVRMDALAVLASGGTFGSQLDSLTVRPAGIDQLLVQHQLVMVDAFAQDLARLGLDPWGAGEFVWGDVTPPARTA
jgi:hypothetical protein